MEPFNWIITQKKGEYYYVPTNLYDFFFFFNTHRQDADGISERYRNVETQ